MDLVGHAFRRRRGSLAGAPAGRSTSVHLCALPVPARAGRSRRNGPGRHAVAAAVATRRPGPPRCRTRCGTALRSGTRSRQAALGAVLAHVAGHQPAQAPRPGCAADCSMKATCRQGRRAPGRRCCRRTWPDRLSPSFRHRVPPPCRPPRRALHPDADRRVGEEGPSAADGRGNRRGRPGQCSSGPSSSPRTQCRWSSVMPRSFGVLAHEAAAGRGPARGGAPAGCRRPAPWTSWMCTVFGSRGEVGQVVRGVAGADCRWRPQ